jgi:GAF domain-containing protein
MNLKSAARLLGVHYQTAYRYVRSGQLTAVRTANGYEISPAAIEMLRARLDSQRDLADLPHPPVGDEASSLEDEVALLMRWCTLSAQPVFDLVTRSLATTYRDSCTIFLLSADGAWLQHVSSFNPDPIGRAELDAFHASTPLRPADASADSALFAGRTVNHHHVDVADSVRLLTPRFAQYSDRLLAQEYISAPVKGSEGRVLGVLTLTRFVGGQPFSAAVTAHVDAMAARVAAAIEQVERCTTAWIARDNLYERVAEVIRLKPRVAIGELDSTIDELLDDDVAEAVFGADRQLVTANAAFTRRFVVQPSTSHVERLSDGAFDADAAHDMSSMWAHLLSGTSDFASTAADDAVAATTRSRILWAVLRRPDAEVAAIIAVCEPAAPRRSNAMVRSRRRMG